MIVHENRTGEDWYKIVCDNNCNNFAENYDGRCWMPDTLSAENMANEYGWAKIEDKHFCDDCHHYDDEGEIIIDD